MKFLILLHKIIIILKNDLNTLTLFTLLNDYLKCWRNYQKNYFDILFENC